MLLLPPANEVWGKVIFLHQFVILFTGGACVVAPGGPAWLLGGACVVAPGGACVVALGGMHGCSGGVCGCSRGVRGFIRGRGFIQRGMHGFIWGGVHGFFSFFGYNEIRSMSGRYASYWNAFLLLLHFDKRLLLNTTQF